MSPWLILLIIVIIVFIVWWALLRNARLYKPDFEMHGHEEEQDGQPETTVDAPVEETPAASIAEQAPEAVIATPPEPDDLTKIEGIGPKADQVLQEAGVHTFAQLAETSPESLKAILVSAGLQLLDPGTWAEQARLISEGKIEEFEALIGQLRGGRRTD